ncbi:MAG: IS110 family transposase [Actinomycetota bacterium]|nr:IS110 family transposase [Actinomycetota bacterium]
MRRPEPGGVGVIVEDFTVPPTLEGLARLSKRLADRDICLAVAEPTSMTWLGLSIALDAAGIDLALVGSRHVSRLRGAVSGKNKSDVIDAQLLSRAGELFALQPAALPDAATLALQRACRRRHKLLIEANRCWRRIIALGRWAFPDTWNALGGSRAAVLAVLRRWPHLEALSRARVATIAEEIAAHSRGVRDVTVRAIRVRDSARDWVAFWDGHIDLDALAWELADLLDELAGLDARVAGAGAQATRWWQTLWGDDDVLLSVPGVGPTVAPTIRAFLGDGSRFPEAKQAASFVGVAPSNWSSGTVTQPSRAISKEGPAALRLGFYQAANAARTVDPQLAAFYRVLMVERGHCHAQAGVAITRKLITRTWRTITGDRPYQFRDLHNNPVTRGQAAALARSLRVPTDVRRRSRAHSNATQRGRLPANTNPHSATRGGPSSNSPCPHSVTRKSLTV